MKTAYRSAAIGSAILIVLLFILFPANAMSGISEGLELFVVQVLPAMFPFFFVSNMLTSLGVGEDLGRILRKPVRALFRAPEAGGYVMTFSLLSGYPMGARMICDCFERGTIDARGAKALVAFTSTSGPLFIVGTVGQNAFGSPTLGIALLAAHYLGAFLNGVFYGLFRRGDKGRFPLSPLTPSAAPALSLGDSLAAAIRSTLLVGGWIALFNFIISVLVDFGALSAIGNAALYLGLNPAAVQGTFAGIVEVTRGAILLGRSGAPYTLTIPLASALIGFGGLSVAFQSMTFLAKTGVGAPYFLLTKCTQALFSALVGFVIALLCFPH